MGYTQWEDVGYGIPESPFLLHHDGRWHLWITDNILDRTYRFWAEAPFNQWSWERCAYFLGCTTGWDSASQDPPLQTAGATGQSKAVEILDTRFGWRASYYMYDPLLAKTVLQVEPVGWHDGHPFIQVAW